MIKEKKVNYKKYGKKMNSLMIGLSPIKLVQKEYFNSIKTQFQNLKQDLKEKLMVINISQPHLYLKSIENIIEFSKRKRNCYLI